VKVVSNLLGSAVVALAFAATAEAFQDIECKAKNEIMITQPGSYERVVSLVSKGKTSTAKPLVHCMISKGRGVFIVGKPARGKELYVPVSTGDCLGETYRPHLQCPGDPPPKPLAKAKKK
jgi:hypothetical protein